MKRKIILSVTNDLSSEQRVHKVCLFLLRRGYDVLLVGRKRRISTVLDDRAYSTKRLSLIFEKGFLFYAEYNIRLFLYLLFQRADVLVSNDLDTLFANYLACKMKGCILVHDSHEYYTGVPELDGRPVVRSVWKRIEKWIFPKLKLVYTVNESIAELYRKEYGADVKVVRNFPLSAGAVQESSADDLTLELKKQKASGKEIILYQGSVNVDRGLLEAVEAMQYVEQGILMIIGEGDILQAVKSRVRELKLEQKVLFHHRVPFEALKQFTALASLGISLDKDTNLNYRYSLPNKIFDFVHAGVPVLASAMVEIKKIYDRYEIGMLIENHDPKEIAAKMNVMLSDRQQRERWKQNCGKAALELCWEKEELVLEEIYPGV